MAPAAPASSTVMLPAAELSQLRLGVTGDDDRIVAEEEDPLGIPLSTARAPRPGGRTGRPVRRRRRSPRRPRADRARLVASAPRANRRVVCAGRVGRRRSAGRVGETLTFTSTGQSGVDGLDGAGQEVALGGGPGCAARSRGRWCAAARRCRRRPRCRSRRGGARRRSGRPCDGGIPPEGRQVDAFVEGEVGHVDGHVAAADRRDLGAVVVEARQEARLHDLGRQFAGVTGRSRPRAGGPVPVKAVKVWQKPPCSMPGPPMPSLPAGVPSALTKIILPGISCTTPMRPSSMKTRSRGPRTSPGPSPSPKRGAQMSALPVVDVHLGELRVHDVGVARRVLLHAGDHAEEDVVLVAAGAPVLGEGEVNDAVPAVWRGCESAVVRLRPCPFLWWRRLWR